MTGGRAYVTYFDERYLARALVMLGSLRRWDPEAEVFALCLDAASQRVVEELADPRVHAIAHESVLDFEPRLRACAGRPRHAFYATHKPVLPLYVWERRPELARVTHVDADVMFYSPMAPVFEEMGDRSIVLSPHRYPPQHSDWAGKYGRFNAGFISWRNDATGRACLADYLEDCLHRVEPDTTSGHFMNQGYLSDWPERYGDVHVLAHPGVNLAPWNVASHRLVNRRVNGADEVTVDGVPLVFFHFSGMFTDADGCWRTFHLAFGEANLAVALLKIYQPYFRAVDAEVRQLRERGIEPAPVEMPAGLEMHFVS